MPAISKEAWAVILYFMYFCKSFTSQLVAVDGCVSN